MGSHAEGPSEERREEPRAAAAVKVRLRAVGKRDGDGAPLVRTELLGHRRRAEHRPVHPAVPEEVQRVEARAVAGRAGDEVDEVALRLHGLAAHRGARGLELPGQRARGAAKLLAALPVERGVRDDGEHDVRAS